MSRALVILLVAAAACVKPDPSPRFTPAWEKFDASGSDWWRSRVALLCADCQFNNNYCRPLPERNLSAEAIAGTAIRPPQLDLFAPEVLEWILREGSPQKDVVLHLGDATNVATTGEFDRFVATMEKADKPWFMAPGNHDVYYFGVYETRDPKLLEDASYESGEPMDKAKFIRRYVSAILRQEEPGCLALGRALGLERRPSLPLEIVAEEIPDDFAWRADVADRASLLRRIEWHIDRENPPRSYIIQSMDLGATDQSGAAVRVFLLDSCQYQRHPEMTPNAWGVFPMPLNCGLTGEMLPDQLRAVRRWLDERRPYQSTVIMFHHPFANLAPRSRSSLGWLWRERDVALVVTAHTHAGFFRHHELGGESGSLELNIGSTTDWPMEWRLLQGFANARLQKSYVRAPRFTLVDALQTREGFFQPGWEVPMRAPDDYRSYKQGEPAAGYLIAYYLGFHYTPYWLDPPRIKANRATRETELSVKNTLLWTYDRLVTRFPTAGDSSPQWPAGCRSDADVLARVRETASEKYEETRGIPNVVERRRVEEELYDQKIALLVELQAFEQSRRTADPDTGRSLDEERFRYKISQAAWASRFMKEKGRRLRVEDETIRVDWEKSMAKRVTEEGAATTE